MFEEEVLATSLSEQGAQISLSANVRLGQTLILRNPRNQKELVSHVVRWERRTGCPHVGVEFLRPAPDFWRLEPQIGRKSNREPREVWSKPGLGCRALAVRLLVWLRSGLILPIVPKKSLLGNWRDRNR